MVIIMKINKHKKILIPLLVVGLFEGCIVHPHHDPYYDQGFIGGTRPPPAYNDSGGYQDQSYGPSGGYYEDDYYDSRPRRRLRSAARGAAGGAIIGAIAGDAGKGAAIGAAAGGIFGGRRRY